jgi:molecular chaperone GrpE (heat shock protein)
MSSSDSFPDWEIFAKREVPYTPVLISPISEILALIQFYNAREELFKTRTKNDLDEKLKNLAYHAVLVYQFESALERYQPILNESNLGRIHLHMRVLKDQMREALKTEGLEIIAPMDKSFEEVADFVTIDGWKRGAEFQTEVVIEVIEPIIAIHDRIIRLGRVVMGSPESSNPEVNEDDNMIHEKESKETEE